MKVWALLYNCFLQQRQKSCPSESAAVCKPRSANNISLCCSTESVEYVKRRVWLAQRLCGEFIRCQQSMSGLQSMPISFIGFSLLLCHHMHHHHQYNITFCGSVANSVRGSTTLVHTEVFWVIWWFAMKSGSVILGSQRINSNDISDPLTFPLVHHEVDSCGLGWNFTTSFVWIQMFIITVPISWCLSDKLVFLGSKTT